MKLKRKNKNKITKEETYKQNEKDNERLNYVGFVLSKKFKFLILLKASQLKESDVGEEGQEVHGYMERMFPDYKWLTSKFVLDRACHFALEDYKPEAHNIIDEYDFPNMYRGLVILKEKKAHFTHYPMFKFDRMVVYSDEPLEKELTWITDDEWLSDDGYESEVTLGPCCFLNMGSPLYDLPVLVISWALGKNKLYFNAKTSAEDLIKERDELIRKRMFTLREKEKNMEDLIDELEIESGSARKKYSDLKYKLLSRDTATNKEKFNKWEKSYDRKVKYDVKRIVGYIILALIVIFVVIFFIVPFLQPKPPVEIIDDIPNISSLISNIINIKGV
ncbi:hypothetical protein LCGC14_0664750 [marine sediment metagenome]|uniref:Uncharacterized protein n=1 Tax=marine sediment metagenome TaxID=412755 RepID=A0A0F9QXP1_9ZZZZ